MLIRKWAVRLLSAGLMYGAGMAALAADYRVTQVENWDTLNVRRQPDSQSAVVTSIPHDGRHVRLQGESRQNGRTRWVKIIWQGREGWVNQRYLEPETAQPVVSAPSASVDKKPVSAPAEPASTTPARAPAAVSDTKSTSATTTLASPNQPIQKQKQSGMWILECGDRSPYWKVDILPEWISGTLGEHKTGMPITFKHQEHGQYRNIALKTEIRGANRWNKLDLTLVYNKACHSTLSKRRVTFSVTGHFNDTAIEGCCRALQVQ